MLTFCKCADKFLSTLSKLETRLLSVSIQHSTSTSVTLTPIDEPTTVATKFFLLEIVFYQEVNGTQYLLRGTLSALSIIEAVTFNRLL